MSLTKLLTELQQRIIDFIDNTKDLCSMAQVSKYYQKLAKPHLYRHLDFHEDGFVNHCPVLIFYLATGLNSLILEDNTARETTIGCQLDILASIIWNDFCSSENCFGRAVAAFNGGSTRHDPVCPIPRLTSLDLITRYAVPIVALPGLRTLRINGTDEVKVLEYISSTASYDLQTLEISYATGSPIKMARAFSDDRAVHLRRLILDQFNPYPENSLQPIIETLIKECHKLEYLQLTITKTSAIVLPRLR
ncbi:hypothetical protein E8E11_002499 [Didymella keratinophila]|nr:hypothetical protein E8E11_002499 [Didymella keratinophila]